MDIIFFNLNIFKVILGKFEFVKWDKLYRPQWTNTLFSKQNTYFDFGPRGNGYAGEEILVCF